eukprot:5695560-Pyramimonas_sp.AAC.1
MAKFSFVFVSEDLDVGIEPCEREPGFFECQFPAHHAAVLVTRDEELGVLSVHVESCKPFVLPICPLEARHTLCHLAFS